MTEVIDRKEFDELMKHNNFIIDKDNQVVCNLCSGNCGQCGAGRHQSRCQEFVDKTGFNQSTDDLKKMIGGVIIAVLAGATMLFLN